MDNSRIAYIELFGATLAGVKRPDQGLYWTDLTGWWGLPDLRGETDDKPGTHGRFVRTQYLRSSRVLTLTGHILAGSNRELMAVRDRLESKLAEGYGLMRVVTSEYGAWDRMVEIDTLDIEPDHGKHYVKFTVDMVAPDPRRYGPEQLVGPVDLPVSTGGVNLPQRMPWNFGSTTQESRLIVSNGGAIPVYPTILVSGGFDSVTVVDITGGRRLSLQWPIPAGETLALDSGARRATMGVSDITRWMTNRQWFEILPGDTHEFRFEALGPIDSPQMWARFKIGAW